MFKHPFTMMICGPTSSGKTVLTRKILKNMDTVIDTKFTEIIWCYSQWQDIYEELEKEFKIKFYNGLPDSKDIPDDKLPRLLISDDQMREADERLVDIFTKFSHHKNMSVIFIVQNLFHQKKGQRDISLNAMYLILMKNPRDAAQITHLARQLYPTNPAYVQEAYKDATRKPHSYLLIDLRQDTDELMRYRANIFDKYVTVYIPKRNIKESEEIEI
jgi:uncharacterized membrane protein YheB (UPF0754 family)